MLVVHSAALAALLLSGAVESHGDGSRRGRQHRDKPIDDLLHSVPHALHRPTIHSASGLGAHVPDHDLALRMELPLGSSGRTATVTASVARNLVSADYTETIYRADGSAEVVVLPDSQRRCYWRGDVTFSDGATGSMAFSSCGRTSRPHAEYLASTTTTTTTTSSTTAKKVSGDGSDKPANSPMHYIRGLIRDHHSGKEYAVEPRDWAGFAASNQAATSSATAARRVLRDHEEASLLVTSSKVAPVAVALEEHFTYEVSDYLDAAHDDAPSVPAGCGNDMGNHAETSSSTAGHQHQHQDQDQDHEHSRRRLSDANTEAWAQYVRDAALSARAGDERRELVAASGEGSTAAAHEKFLGLQLSNDYTRCQDLGVEGAGDETLSLINQVALFYGQAGVQAGFNYDIRVYLAGQNFFSDGNPYDKYVVVNSDGSVDIDDLIVEFRDWSHGSYTAGTRYAFEQEKLDYEFHAAHLLSHEDFSTAAIGYAYQGQMCNPPYSSGINQVDGAFNRAVITITHELGHNLGMAHDGSGNSCSKTSKIMASTAGTNLDITWSSCSAAYVNGYGSGGGYDCLFTTSPTEVWQQTCGDGVVTGDEECDSAGQVDGCCDATTCKLVAGALCSPSNDDCCTHTCGFVPFAVGSARNVMCRAADGDCDVPEYCHGDSSKCPEVSNH
jgi:hypothetical protein